MRVEAVDPGVDFSGAYWPGSVGVGYLRVLVVHSPMFQEDKMKCSSHVLQMNEIRPPEWSDTCEKDRSLAIGE